MKAVVLVGGEGTRLRPLTLSAPKQMLPIVGVPMIERVLGHLAAHGIDDAVLSLGYLPDAFLEAYPDGRVAGMGLTYAVEPEPLDTAGAVRFAATFAGIDETFVVVNGDVLTDLDLTTLVAFHRERGAEGTIALHPVADPSAFGVVPTDDDGRVTGLRREAATRRGADQRNQRRDLRARALGARADPRGGPGLDRAGDLPRHGARRRALRPLGRQLLARHRDPGRLPGGQLRLPERQARPVVAPGVADRGDGVLLRGRQRAGGQVRGPSVIFAGCVIESGARVERSILGPGTVVSSGCGGVRFGAHGRVPCRSRRQGGRFGDGPALHRGAAG